VSALSTPDLSTLTHSGAVSARAHVFFQCVKQQTNHGASWCVPVTRMRSWPYLDADLAYCCKMGTASYDAVPILSINWRCML
jgi:hypothetical protein